jgi:hypothetical protein
MDDRDAIRDLCFAYTFCLDDGDFAGVGALLEHATLQPDMPGVVGEKIHGRDGVEAFYRAQVITYSRGRPMTRHLITNQVIAIDDERRTASSRCYFTVLQRPPGIGYHVVVGGQYHDEFERIGDVWRFTSKRIQVDHLNDIEHHFRITDEHAG